MFYHVLIGFLRHEMSDILAFFDAVSDEGGRYLYHRRLQHRHMGMKKQFAADITFSGKNQKLIIVDEGLKLPPAGKPLQAIHATDKNKLVLRILGG